MKKIFLLFAVFLFMGTIAYAGTYTSGYKENEVEKLIFQGISAPSESLTNDGNIYFDVDTGLFKVSENGGAYVNLVGGGSGGGSSFTYLTESGALINATAPLTISSDLTVISNLLVASKNGSTPYVAINLDKTSMNPNSAALVVRNGGSTNALWIENDANNEIIFAGASADANIYQAWGSRDLYISTNSGELFLGYGANQDDIEIGVDYINMDNGTLYLDQTDNTVEISGALTVDGGTLYVNSDANKVETIALQASDYLTVTGNSSLGQLIQVSWGASAIETTQNTLKLSNNLTLAGQPVGALADITNTTLSLSTSGNAYIGSDLSVIGVVNPVGGIFLSEDWPGDLSISNNLTVNGDVYGGVRTVSISGSYSANQMDIRGGVIYCDGKGVITLPAVVDGGSLTVLTVGTNGIQIDPNASDKIWLDGVALDDGDKINSLSASGNIAVLTYYSADGWYASTDSWTDGG